MSDYQPATEHVERQLEAFHAGTLQAAEAERVERHLRECAACREQSAQVGVYHLIRAAPAPTVGQELRRRVYARIAAASAPSYTTERPSRLAALADRHTHDARYASDALQTRARLGWLSGAVAVVIVALIASVIWALPHGTQRTGAGKHSQTPTLPVSCPASATSVKLPANAMLGAIALTSPTSGWAVGSLTRANGVPTQGLLMRFSQCHWTPVPLDLPNVALSQVSMDSPTDGWIIGANQDTNTPVLLHYGNGSWRQEPLPSVPIVAHSSFAQIRMRAPGDGWITAFTPKTSQGQMSPTLLLHLSGESWAPVNCPLPIVFDVAPVGPNDLWVTGEVATPTDQPSAFRFAHYHNGQWTIMKQPGEAGLTVLQAVSPTDIWASASIWAGGTFVAHYNGANWQAAPQDIPTDGTRTNLIALGDGTGWAMRYGPLATPRDAPAQTYVINVWRESAGQWQALPWPYKDLNGLATLAPVSSDEIWALGSFSVQTTVTQNGVTTSTNANWHTVLLHYVDGQWSRYGG